MVKTVEGKKGVTVRVNMVDIHWTPDLKECLNWSTTQMIKNRMHPIGILYNKSADGTLTHLTFTSENKSIVPPKGTYNKEPKLLTKFPGDE